MININRDSVTLPVEVGQEKKVLSLAEKWGADAFRDSDGTTLSDEIINSGRDIYSTLCLVRADQEWSKTHLEQTVCKFLMSKSVVARSETIEIDPMSTYCSNSYALDTREESFVYWEVMDRTEGVLLRRADWGYNYESRIVRVFKAKEGHLYTVSFLVRMVWDITSRHNYITNKWTGEHVVAVDPSYSESYNHLIAYFDKWLDDHPHTDVVRFTSLAYHFPSDRDHKGRTCYTDWHGYCDTVSPPALAAFEKEYGYRLRAEDFVDQGYYNLRNRVPSKRYCDWMEFTQKRVNRFAHDLVKKTHASCKRAAFYHGDHWIGMELYKPEFSDICFDIVIGVPVGGTTVRHLVNAPGDHARELRMRPYFFPNELTVMDPVKFSQGMWVKIRRAMLRSPGIDRIGYGGYLSLANKYPHFVNHIAELCDEFRIIKAKIQQRKPMNYLKVAVISAWGKLRSWTNDGSIEKEKFGAPEHASDPIECLAGLPVDVEFISFDDIKANGIPDDVEVILNTGDAGTSWSGGKYWEDPEITSIFRKWIADGGGFVGIGGATIREFQGRVFQLTDVLGVEKENGNSSLHSSQPFVQTEEHFIKEDIATEVNFGIDRSFVALSDEKANVLKANGKHILMSAHNYYDGRAVYIAGLPYSLQNARILLRSLVWTARKEDALKKCFSSNPMIDCAFYPENGCMVVVNNTDEKQSTMLYDFIGDSSEIKLSAFECRWL